MADPERLVALASSVSDGTPVDWDSQESAAGSAEEREMVRRLRAVAAIARFHGGPGPEEEALPARFGPFEILERVARGGFGEVFRARDPRLDREVALKILRPRAGAPPGQLLEEARRLARIRHPNVVTIHGADLFEGRVALWTEFVHGRTLADLVRERGRMGAEKTAAIGRALCRALAAVHGAGLLHLDVKARNVIREDGGRIVLVDLGLGRDRHATEAAEAAGTPAFMAPEILRGEAPDVRSDLYSLGVLLYFLLTGRHPVEGEDVGALSERHAKGERTPLADRRPGLPAPLVQAVERALAADPAARFASAAEMEQALAVGAAGPATAAATGRSSFWRRAALPGLLAAAVALAFLTWGRRSAPRPVPPEPVSVQPEAAGAPGAGAAALQPEGYTVEAALFRGDRQRTPLASGDRVAVGDSLSLSIKASQPVHVYVIDQDDRGEAYLLFPLPGFDLENPVPGGISRILPGTRRGVPFYWQVTSAGGREHFLIVASPERLRDFEADLLALSRPAEGAPLTYLPLSAAALEHLRGVGGLVQGAGAAAGGPLFETAALLVPGEVTARGVWIRRVDLENPLQ